MDKPELCPPPNSGTAIGESTFKGCESLAIITIPVSLAVFQDNVFQGAALWQESLSLSL